MRTLVTGAAGFIGSHVCEQLAREGHQVLGLDDLSGGFRDNVPEGVEFVTRSVNAELRDVFDAFRPQAVYHLAAYAAEGLSHHIPSFNYTNNVLGTVNVLTEAMRVNADHFVFTSSIAAYGHPHASEAFDEESPCVPCDPYGTAKLACEHHIRASQQYFGGFSYTIFRPHNVFGPRQNISDPYRNVVGIFIARALEKRPMPVFGDGTQTRSFSYITPVAAGIAAAPFVERARNQTFNIGGDEPMSVIDLARNVSEVMGVALQVEHLPPRNEVQHAHCSHDRAKLVFGSPHTNEVSIRVGLERMAEFVRSRPIPPATECPSRIEIRDRLPGTWAARLDLPSGR